MNKQQILDIAKRDPKFSQAVMALEQQVGNEMPPKESVDELVHLFEFAINHPDKYASVREAAIKDNLIEAEDMPERPDPVFLVSMLVMLYGVQERQKQGFARGGLASSARRLQAQGRGGDTVLAHINPEEAAMLRAHGGSGTINPTTGLPEYFSLKKFLGAALPFVLDFIVPGAGTILGTALGASAAWAPIVGGALIGGASSALTGGNALQGALMGGLGGGLAGTVGGAANNALGLGLGSTGQAMLGGGLAGGLAGMATGQGFGKGAMQGALGQYAGSQIAGMGDAGTALGKGVQAGGQNFGNMLTAGYDPKTAAVSGGLTGLAVGMKAASTPIADKNIGLKPSQSVIEGLKAPADYMSSPLGEADYSLSSVKTPSGYDVGDMGTGVKMPTTADAAVAPGSSGLDKFTKYAPLAMMAASALGGAPEEVKQAVNTMSPAQQEYFNRPSVAFDWNRMQQDANKSGMGLSQYMAQNWNQIAGGAYNQEVARPGYAEGGLAALARFAEGAGSGRDDTIDAKLSDGEYVMDAETVAMLGDGSNKEGARRLDSMRAQIRKQKGKALSRGKISPDAMSPLAYLKGAK